MRQLLVWDALLFMLYWSLMTMLVVCLLCLRGFWRYLNWYDKMQAYHMCPLFNHRNISVYSSLICKSSEISIHLALNQTPRIDLDNTLWRNIIYNFDNINCNVRMVDFRSRIQKMTSSLCHEDVDWKYLWRYSFGKTRKKCLDESFDAHNYSMIFYTLWNIITFSSTSLYFSVNNVFRKLSSLQKFAGMLKSMSSLILRTLYGGVVSRGLAGVDCAWALLIYRLSNFSLLPFKDDKWGCNPSPTSWCRATIQNTEAFLTLDSTLSYA